MSDSKLEMREVEDYERLRSLGYNRLALFEYYMTPAVNSAALVGILGNTTYGSGVTLGASGNDLSYPKMIAHSLKAVATYLEALRDGTAATRWNISGNLGPLIQFAQEATKGYLREKITAPPTDGWLLETATGNLTAGSADLTNRTHASETGSEDWFRLWGYYYGLTMKQIQGSHNVAAHGTAAKRMFRFSAARGLMILATVPIIAVIQSEIAKINIGRKLGVIPSEYDILEGSDVPDEWMHLFTGRFPATVLDDSNPTADAPGALANYVHLDFSYLPQTALINILRQRLKVWKIPKEALDIARTMFGLAYSEFDYPTNFGVFFNVGDEQDTDKKYVGYGLLWAIHMLDQFYGNARTASTYNLSMLFEQVLNSEHWTYKGFKEQHKDAFSNFSLSTLKGQMEPSYFPVVKPAFRTEDATIARGHWSNGRDFQATDPLIMMAITAPDGVTAIFNRSGVNLDQLGAFFRYHLLFNDGAPGAGGGNTLLDAQAILLGEHYYTRTDKVINYVGPDNGQTNIRVGADIAYNTAMFNTFGINLEDVTQDWSSLLTSTTSRLPTSKFPMPKIIEEIYDMDKVVEIANVILPQVSGGGIAPGVSTNTNENANGSEEGED